MTTWKARTAAAIAVCAIVTACAPGPDRTRVEATGAGTLIGAGLGAGVGAYAGGGRGAAIGAGVGGLIGGVIGAVFGDRAASEQEEYARQERLLRADIRDLRALNQQLDRELIELRRRDQALVRQQASLRTALGQQRQAQLAASGRLAAERRRVAQQLDAVRADRATVAAAAARTSDPWRRRELIALDQRLAESERLLTRRL